MNQMTWEQRHDRACRIVDAICKQPIIPRQAIQEALGFKKTDSMYRLERKYNINPLKKGNRVYYERPDAVKLFRED